MSCRHVGPSAVVRLMGGISNIYLITVSRGTGEIKCSWNTSRIHYQIPNRHQGQMLETQGILMFTLVVSSNVSLESLLPKRILIQPYIFSFAKHSISSHAVLSKQHNV